MSSWNTALLHFISWCILFSLTKSVPPLIYRLLFRNRTPPLYFIHTVKNRPAYKFYIQAYAEIYINLQFVSMKENEIHKIKDVFLKHFNIQNRPQNLKYSCQEWCKTGIKSTQPIFTTVNTANSVPRWGNRKGTVSVSPWCKPILLRKWGLWWSHCPSTGWQRTKYGALVELYWKGKLKVLRETTITEPAWATLEAQPVGEKSNVKVRFRLR
jgi:hypothetical protein